MSLYQFDALRKLDSELKSFKGGQKEGAVKAALYNALADFCRQDDEFAQAVVQCDKTLSDCAAAAMKGVGSSISDLEVYHKAVQFYFPGAEVRMTMTVDLVGAAGADAEGESKSAGVVLDLSDFL